MLYCVCVCLFVWRTWTWILLGSLLVTLLVFLYLRTKWSRFLAHCSSGSQPVVRLMSQLILKGILKQSSFSFLGFFFFEYTELRSEIMHCCPCSSFAYLYYAINFIFFTVVFYQLEQKQNLNKHIKCCDIRNGPHWGRKKPHDVTSTGFLPHKEICQTLFAFLSQR